MQQCKLCLRHVPRLEKSHFLPAGVYRILRDDGEKNPNPWQLTRTNSVQTSWQMKASLLCFDCEQRLCKHGEAWVLAHCLKKDGAFPLASILAGRSPALASDETTTRRQTARPTSGRYRPRTRRVPVRPLQSCTSLWALRLSRRRRRVCHREGVHRRVQR
jgi:hypothetical protein